MTEDKYGKPAGFSDIQLELLAHLLEEEGVENPASQMILTREEKDKWPLSFAQKRLWFLNQLEPNNPAYNVSAYVQISGPLQPEAFNRSLNGLVVRHETLRTIFVNEQGKPKALVKPSLHLHIPLIDLCTLSSVHQTAEVQRLAHSEARFPFDLEQGPLLRAKLLRLDEQEHVLFLTLHHIITDGWSMSILTRELAALAQSEDVDPLTILPPLPIQYADFAAWQTNWLEGDALQSQLTYWQKQLKDAPALLELPTDFPRPDQQTFQGKRRVFHHASDLADSLNKLAHKENVTLFMLLLAAYHLLLYRYSEQTDILVGTPIANRNRPEIEGLIGFFVNTLVMRTRLKPNMTFYDLLTQLREVALAAYAHQDLPFERLVQSLQVERHLNYSPLFQVMFNLQQDSQMEGQDWGGISLRPFPIDSNVSKFDLTLSIVQSDGSLMSILEYNSNLFEDETAQRMLAHYDMLLQSIVHNPHQRLHDIPLLTPAELEQLLVKGNDTKLTLPPVSSFLELFEKQVASKPDAVAITAYSLKADQNISLTYRQLNSVANQLGHYLQKQGVGPEVRVGVYLERSVEMLITLLGILKAGGAYIPLDPMFPQERLVLMINDAAITYLVSQSHLQNQLPDYQVHTLFIDSEWPKITEEPNCNLPTLLLHTLAYIIYTSGSTGRPKGVQVPHSALLNFLWGMEKTLSLQPEDKLLAITTLSFDIAALELYLPLLCGAEVVIAQTEEVSDGTLLLKKLLQSSCTVMQATPTTWRMLLSAGWLGTPRIHVWCGGEALPYGLAQQLQKIGLSVWNLYGPTETTIWSSATRVSPPVDIISLGSPIANTQLYVLDSQGQPVPPGIPGELYIGGVGVTRGYFNRSRLTAKRFVPNPFYRLVKTTYPDKESVFFEGILTRLYRTGDRVRYRSGTKIEFLGRMDYQVKIRGFRIELEEIETILDQHPSVAHSVAIVREDRLEDKRLVAYMVPATTADVPADSDLRSFLKKKLPDYMLPNHFVWLEVFPLTNNGKVNRQALPLPEMEDKPNHHLTLRTPLEEAVAETWCRVLNLSAVGRKDNFFLLGGHSLLATQVISQINQTFGVELPLRRLFEFPTIADLAQNIQLARQADAGSPGGIPLEPVSRERALPLSFAQQRLWFIDQLEPDNAAYNIPSALRLKGNISLKVLERAFNHIRERHENLRCRFINEAGKARLIIDSYAPRPLPLIDLQSLPDEGKVQEEQRLIQAEAQRPFNLSSGPLLRVMAVRLKPDSHVLLFTMHHIISDAWSMGILLRELGHFIKLFISNQEPDLPKLPIQNADFSVWQRTYLKGEKLESLLSYWRHQLRRLPEYLNLPTDYSRSAALSEKGAQYHFNISTELTEQLVHLSQQQGVTLFMILLAAFNTLLHRYTGQEDIIIGVPLSNRTRPEIEGLIGFFVNTLPLRTVFINNPTFKELLKQVRETTLNAYDHQELPLELILQDLKLERSASHSPLFQVVFVYQNAPTSFPSLPDLEVDIIKHEGQTAKFDLVLNITPTAEGLRGMFEYRSDLFKPSTVERYISHWRTLLQQVAKNPQQHLWNIPLITEDEQLQLARWSVS